MVDAYQNHPTFLALRDPDHFKGKCGICEYRADLRRQPGPGLRGDRRSAGDRAGLRLCAGQVAGVK